MENKELGPDDVNKKVREILDAAFYTFSVEAMDDSGRQPGSRAEIEEVKKLMIQARDLNPTDQELITEIEEYEAICNEAYERRFVGFKWLMIIAGLYASFFFYNGCSTLKDRGELTQEIAATRLTDELQRTDKYIADMAVAPDSIQKARKKYIKKQSKRAEELTEMDAKDYLKEMKKKSRKRAMGDFRTSIFWFILIALYYKSTLAPVFLINKRQRQMALVMASAGFLKKIVLFLAGLFLALPVTDDYKIISRSTGSVVGHTSEISPLLMIKIFGLAIIAMFLLMMALIGLPILTIVGFLRNYKYEQVDSYFEKGVEKLKGYFKAA
ncbi:MAG: hypothetical protein JEZ09_13665 [Salinivirgaceae bacterium]|nr:hypothetical protein [Salinivirgaceae bacterium]